MVAKPEVIVIQELLGQRVPVMRQTLELESDGPGVRVLVRSVEFPPLVESLGEDSLLRVAAADHGHEVASGGKVDRNEQDLMWSGRSLAIP